MNIASDLHFDFIAPRLKVNNGRQALLLLLEQLSYQISCTPGYIAEKLIESGKDQRTGPNGLVIWDLQLRQASTQYAAMATLKTPVSMNVLDKNSFDAVCVLISPEGENSGHLQRLARMTRLLKNDDLLEKIRGAENAETVQALLTAPDGWLLAA